MAYIYTKCGRYDEALSEIEKILSFESIFTVNNFKMDKVFEPLWGLPKFKELMKIYALKAEPYRPQTL